MIHDLGINIGPLSIRWYAIIILLGATLSLKLAIKEGAKFQISRETMYDLFFIFMLCGIIGARVYYVAFEWQHFAQNPLKIFAIYEGGIAIYGGVIGAAIGGAVYCFKKGYNALLLADIVAPVLLLAQSIGRWGNFVNIEAYGSVVPGNNAGEQVAYLKQFFIPDFIIERMRINGMYHHPTFLYESLWTFAGFILLYFIIRQWKNLRLSVLTLSYFVWYGIGRFMIEGLRTDSLYLVENIRISQVVSLILVIVGIIGLLYIYLNRKRLPLYLETSFTKI
ncbi:prolipoprotein diacylglyceryl transferase [Erysipelotrichaceae bacterium]|nr:prolipoprotein diacylglyceryl transferase [Erysipelotrichaceae bacterium]